MNQPEREAQLGDEGELVSAQSLHQKYELPVFGARGITITRGYGARVVDSEGREYIDCMAANGVVNVGHCNKEVVAAISEQAATLISCPGVLYHDKRARLLQRLVEMAPPGIVRGFLCNSGTEAIEGALKFARLATKRANFVAAMRGFHGRTMGALSATHSAKYKEGFEPLIAGFAHVPFNNLERLEAAVDDQTAGVILEVVQGEGGVHVAQAAFLEGARRICTERGAMLIIDEVQTGFCRTGRMFACEHFGVRPDILCLAKALAGGVPAGAILVNAAIHVSTGQHGTTFGGNPLAAAAGLAALDFMIHNELASESREKGAYLLNALNDGISRLGLVREVRGLGLMIGIECKSWVKEAIDRLAQEGVLVLTGGPSVIRLLPPLVITRAEIDTVLEKLFLVLA